MMDQNSRAGKTTGSLTVTANSKCRPPCFVLRDESTSTVPVYTSIVVVSTECANVVVLHDVKACVLL